MGPLMRVTFSTSRATTYYFPKTGSSATLWQRLSLFVSIYWKALIVVLTPLVLLPIPILNSAPAYRCMYVVLIMAIYWVLELLPLPVTSMLPIVLFPTMGILDSDKTCAAYMKETNMMFMGGLMIAAGVQHSKLPKRVALWTVQVVGCSHRRAPMPSDITICYYLSIAYASTLGGCGTLVGTATNSAFKGIFDSEFPEYSNSVDFFWFMAYSTPPMLIMQLLVWFALQITFMGMFRPNSEAARKVNKASSGSETTMKASGLLFILAVFLYIFRRPGFMPGWAEILTNINMLVSSQESEGRCDLDLHCGPDVHPADVLRLPQVLFQLLLIYSNVRLNLIIPDEELAASKPSPSIVTWNILKEKIPWGLLFLLGSKATGLSAMIGSSLEGLHGLNHAVVLLVVVLVTQFITEFTSNVAIANLILPVLANMARVLHIDPRYLMVPATLACSMAFHMPVGTPPNAIVAGVAHIPTSKMYSEDVSVCPLRTDGDVCPDRVGPDCHSEPDYYH
ncbi:hypothetical protein HF086_001605 [Spodoptera exigua]|uniref:Protein I'm not dead yet n=1 Tax=Spodoptera exigua TaxID=7107 RepID=A0A922MP04_SPOEX|nr:hypothetical protein HF086_001605 [Spodoptera exigua]